MEGRGYMEGRRHMEGRGHMEARGHMERSEYMEGNEYMKNTGRRKALRMAAAVLTCSLLIGSTVCASSDQRRDGISSRGAIDYDHGRVVMNAADCIILADEIDALEASYKSGITDALAKIGTYMQQDGGISHESRTDMDPQRIIFRDLEIAILRSQSVAHLAGTQASDTKGLIYYKFETNNILEVTGEDTGMPVLIVPAAEDNLTAQTAAWVDGHSVTGNGADNYYFYQKGFIEGYARKMGADVKYEYDDTGRAVSAKLVFS